MFVLAAAGEVALSAGQFALNISTEEDSNFLDMAFPIYSAFTAPEANFPQLLDPLDPPRLLIFSALWDQTGDEYQPVNPEMRFVFVYVYVFVYVCVRVSLPPFLVSRPLSSPFLSNLILST